MECKGILYTTVHQQSAMGKFLDRHKLLRLTQEKTSNLNRAATSKEIKLVL